MPLRDHFHPPLSLRRRCTSFHGGWAMLLSSQLNRLLPPGYFAEPLCKFVTEIDVATFDETGDEAGKGRAWFPPAPTATLSIAAATDSVQARVYHEEGGLQLVACVELVSPSNKDRPSEREAFVSKCAAYLHEGVGLVVVDIVTARRANLHAALVAHLSARPPQAPEVNLYAVAYQPLPGKTQTELRIWEETLAVRQPLPTMPLCLKDGPCLPLELEATYEQTCRDLRLVSSNGASA